MTPTVRMPARVSGVDQWHAWKDRVLPPVERVRPGVWSVPTPFPDSPLRYVLSYAIEWGDGLAIVDTGWPTEQGWDALVRGVEATGHVVADVHAILVTHGHADHFGLARRLREASGAWIGMHRADATAPSTPEQGTFGAWLTRRGATGTDIDVAASTGARPVIDFRFDGPDRFVEDGDRPLGPGSPLVARWTPGHTPGHLCFHETAHDLLLTGDHILPRISPNISPAPHHTGDTLGEFLRSLRALRDLNPDEVLPAHEYRFRGLSERVDELVAHHDERLAEVLDAVRREPGPSTAFVAARLTWSRPWEDTHGLVRRSAIGETYAHLRHLLELGAFANRGAAVDAWYLTAVAVRA